MVFREFGGPEVLRLEDIDTPEPGPGEVLIKVHYVSVNVTLDTIVRRGVYPFKPSLPHVLGVDPTGEVVAVGAGVGQPAVGDRVAVHLHLKSPDCPPGRESEDIGGGLIGIHRWGGYAQYIAVPAENAFVVPDALSLAEACVVMRHLPTARHMLHKKAELTEGETILVMGATGGLGSCCIQVAKRLGATVIGAAGADERVEKGIEYGADYGINYRTQNLAEEVMKLTDGKGVNVVAENIGDPDLFPGALESLAQLGRMVTAGAHGGGKVTLDVSRLYTRRMRIIGTPGCDYSDVAWSMEAARDGSIKPPAIDRIIPLSEAATAHKMIEAREPVGKVLLDNWT
jgi:NADPH:quinone reductase-like Zn-dependent oxidoreductase